MNAKVEEFLKIKKDELKKKELEQKNAHLISLGLIDESKSRNGIVYLDGWDGTQECKWDAEKQQYYKGAKVSSPIDVTDEEYQEILKYAPINGGTKTPKESETTWANAIKIIANILLALNIIGGIILSIVLSNSYKTDDFAWIPIVSALTYCILWYPLIVGFSKVVKVAEKTLQE